MPARGLKVATTVFGYPRIGHHRDLGLALERYWAGEVSADELAACGRRIRAETWDTMARAGLGELPGNDFTLYDQVLDMACVTGLVPARFGTGPIGPAEYFALARGAPGVPPLEMTGWFDTGYQYLVPEVDAYIEPRLRWRKPIEEYQEALELGHRTRPVLLGPVSLLLLSKPAATAAPDFEPLAMLESLLPVYHALLAELAAVGADWVQLDEPALARSLRPAQVQAVATTYDSLGACRPRPKISVAVFHGPAGDALPALLSSAVEGVGLDFGTHGVANLAELERRGGTGDKRLVAGVVNGRDVWRTDLDAALATLNRLAGLTDDLVVGTSCPLVHVPVDVGSEDDLPPRLRSRLAFARQKLDEVVLLGRALVDGRDLIAGRRPAFGPIGTDDQGARGGGIGAGQLGERPRRVNGAAPAVGDGLPLLPTTTVGSFPRSAEFGRARTRLADGQCDQEEYERAVEREIVRVLALQEEAGLDVLVHGEPERDDDPVRYFAEQLDGFVVTRHGWVRSYGGHHVRPPIIVGDVARRGPMTVRWLTFAQHHTERPVKCALTGPVTLLNRSFVRQDLPTEEVARRLALAVREEISDLEAAGVHVIQIDEPAFVDALPPSEPERRDYLSRATTAFRLATGGAAEQTQVHAHLCYSEFGELLLDLVDLGADVLLVETARSRLDLLGPLAAAASQNAIGLGVYDTRSPRVPAADEITGLLGRALEFIPAERLWVTPDCGLRARRYDEVIPALRNMCAAARSIRTYMSTEK